MVFLSLGAGPPMAAGTRLLQASGATGCAPAGKVNDTRELVPIKRAMAKRFMALPRKMRRVSLGRGASCPPTRRPDYSPVGAGRHTCAGERRRHGAARSEDDPGDKINAP